MLMLRHIKEGGAPHKCWNLGPQLPCYATGHHIIFIEPKLIHSNKHKTRKQEQCNDVKHE